MKQTLPSDAVVSIMLDLSFIAYFFFVGHEICGKPAFVPKKNFHLVKLLTGTYPLCSHVYYMSGDAWKEGGIDATGNTFWDCIFNIF